MSRDFTKRTKRMSDVDSQKDPKLEFIIHILKEIIRSPGD